VRQDDLSEASDRIIATTRRVRGSRRSWSRAEKLRIVEEAFRPGASVADVARHHGLNANQVFNWRRTALASNEVGLEAANGMSAPAAAAFLPIGMIVQTDDDATSPPARGAAAIIGPTPSERATASRPAMDDRSGLIEIDLADGTRLRVDAFVNERALRRVLSVLKAAS
jgi:transposase